MNVLKVLSHCPNANSALPFCCQSCLSAQTMCSRVLRNLMVSVDPGEECRATWTSIATCPCLCLQARKSVPEENLNISELRLLLHGWSLFAWVMHVLLQSSCFACFLLFRESEDNLRLKEISEAHKWCTSICANFIRSPQLLPYGRWDTTKHRILSRNQAETRPYGNQSMKKSARLPTLSTWPWKSRRKRKRKRQKQTHET